MSCVLVKTRLGWDARKKRRSNSLAVSVTLRGPSVTSLVSGLISSEPNLSVEPVPGLACARRNTDFTRATSSRGLNGLTI